jgi:hypothetical protein
MKATRCGQPWWSCLPGHQAGNRCDQLSGETLGAFTPDADLQDQLRIHAVPHLTSQPRRRHEADIRGTPHMSRLQKPGMASAPPNAGCETEDSNKLLEELMQFQRSDQIPCDACEGIRALTNWWNMHRRKITPNQSRKCNRTVQRFIAMQLGLGSATDANRKRHGGPMIPRGCASSRQPPAVDLDPRIYTSVELCRILTYKDSTIRRQAEAAWRKAGSPGPCPLKKECDWYVAGPPENGGGQRHGWKFHKRRTKEDE